MAEAVITRGGIGGGSVTLNDSTYQQLGLNNKSSFDDVILALAYKSNDYATIICDVIEPDGTPAIGANVNFVDGAGIKLDYQTDDTGRCIFKTNSGTANIFDNHKYIDIKPSEVQKVDCPVGFTKFIKFQRKIYDNGYSFSPITENKNVVFSKFINTVDITVIGAGGQGGDVKGTFRGDWDTPSGYVNAGGGGAGNKGTVITNKFSPISNTTYNIVIGIAKQQTQSNSARDASQRWTAVAYASLGSGSGYGATGGTSYFGDISAYGGSGGMNATEDSGNFGLSNGHKNHHTGYSYGDGGNASHGATVYVHSSGTKTDGWTNSGQATYNYTAYVSVSRPIPQGGGGCVFLNNFQYKI